MPFNGTRCLRPKDMQLTTGDVDRFIQQYVFPVQFVFGVIGNFVNLFVLLSKDMRSTANDLLAAIACADLALLFCMLPHSLAAFDIFAEDYNFRYGYFLIKTHLAALANCFSAAAIWLILAVSIERLLGIRSPMHTRFYWKRWRMIALVLCIFGASAALTFHHHLAYECFFYLLCNGTQLFARHFPIASDWPPNHNNTHSEFRQQYLRLSTAANAVLVVIIPIILVMALNISLIRVLKRHDLTRDSFGKVSDVSVRLKQERKVTVTVCAIVTCFTLTQGPSAIAFIWELTMKSNQLSPYFNTVVTVTNSLVVTGKVLNFILFCLSSAHFRRRLRMLIGHRIIKCLRVRSQVLTANNSYRSTSGQALELSSLRRHSTGSRKPKHSRASAISARL